MAGERVTPRRVVAATVGTALAVRLVAVLTWARWADPHGDEAFYWRQAQFLGSGAGFVYRNNVGELVPTAVHPPLYSAYLGLVGLLRLDPASHLPYRLAAAVLGSVAVGLVALVALRLAGPRAGLAAGLLAAVYPNLWFDDVKLTAETMYAVGVGAVLLAAHRFAAAPSPRRAAWLGGAIGAAALARAEALALLVLLLVPLVLGRVPAGARARARSLAYGALVAAVVTGPWLARNLTSFTHPATISSGSGFVIEISNCDQTFGLGPEEAADEYLGYWSPACDRSDQRVHGTAALPWPAGDETVVDAWKRQIGLDYVRSHPRRLPLVLAARVGRIWDVWRPGQSIRLNRFFEGRDAATPLGPVTVEWQAVAMGQYYVLLLLGAAGLVALRRRHITIAPYVAVAASATLTAAISFGITRYRVGADVALCVLAGVGVASLLDRRARRREATG